MENSDFRGAYPGELVAIPEGVHAFVPDPLPPKLDINSTGLQKLGAAANLALGELKGIGHNLQNPYLLIGPLSTREAIVSSKLEGTIASAEELAKLDARPHLVKDRDEVAEVRNYIVALRYGLTRIESLPMSKRLIREIHQKLLEGVRGQESMPGEFRRSQNFIGSKGLALQTMRFVPPPVTEMEASLDSLEAFISGDRYYSPLIDLALIHYQFETIHPFRDGNGRIGRLMIILILCGWEVLPQPLLYMSSFFEKHKDEYRDLLLAVSQQAAWNDWIEFFLRGVVEQSEDAIMRSDRLLMLQQRYREELQSARSSALSLKLIDSLFETPHTTAERAAKLLEVTIATAQNHINRLVSLGVLSEVTGNKRGRLYVAGDIFGVIEDGISA